MGLFSDGKVRIDTELDRKNFENGLNQMENSANKAGNTIKGIVAGLGITKMISAAMNQITSNIDGAISRVDTLNQFPKVMSNLGISTEEADKSIAKMSKKLENLPTTLDDGARAVQRFTSKNGNVAKSTDLFLALNNAILAGGASAEIQSSALEQLSQSYAKGKPDMMEWRTAMTAMPAQLKQVAQAMGYIDADELGQDLREGAVSMDEFMETIVRLNSEGVDGFLSFEEQAKNSTGGIQTSITNAKTQVVKGIADIIGAINTGLANAGLGGIGDVISTIGKKAKEGIDSLAPAVTSIVTFLAKNLPTIISAFKIIAPIILTIVAAFFAYQKTVQAVVMVTKIWTTVQALLNGTLLLNPIGLIVAGIVALIAIIITLYTKCEWFRNLVNLVFEHIINGAKKIWEAVEPLATAIVNIIKIILKALEPVIEWIKKFAMDYIKVYVAMIIAYIDFIVNAITIAVNILKVIIKTIVDVIKSVIDFAKDIPNKVQNFVNRIVGFFKALPSQMLNVGLDIVKGIGNGITSGISWIKSKIKDFVGDVTKFIKKMFKIGSPSKLMKDEVGIYLAQGIGEGFEDEIDSVYKSMQNAINLEQAKLQANVETGKVFNTLQNSTPIAINLNADVEMDSTKVGRLVTPVISKTIKTGGGV